MAMSHGGNPLFWKAKDYATPRDEISVQIGCCLVFVTEFATTTSGTGCIYHRLFSEQWICIGSTRLRDLLKRVLWTEQRLSPEELRQLAEAIIDYGRIQAQEGWPASPALYIIVEIPEIAYRFRESPQTIKDALMLLKAWVVLILSIVADIGN